MRFPQDVPTLSDGVVTLRAHAESDVQDAFEQCQDPVSQQWTTVPIPYSLDDAKRFVRDIMPGGWQSDQEWSFAVEAPDDDGRPRFAGTVSLRNEREGRAEVAYGSHPWVRGRGVMARAVELLLRWGFEERDLRTVIWWANKGNWASRRLAWRLGFSFDGTVRQWLPQRGELLDAWVGALLAEDKLEPRNPWLEIPPIVGERVVLRPHRGSDAARIQEACADERTSHWLSRLPRPYTLEDARAYLATRLEHAADGTAISWAIADPVTDDLLGTISLFDIKLGDDAEIGYWAHPAARGRGLMSEACDLVVRHAFVPVEDGGVGLRRLKIFAAEGNTASLRVIANNGFVQNGQLRRDSPLGDGSFVDTLSFDLLREEYTR